MNLLTASNNNSDLVGPARVWLKSILSYSLVVGIFFQLLFGSVEILSEKELLKYEIYGPHAVSITTSVERQSFEDSREKFQTYNFKHITPFFKSAKLGDLSEVSKEKLVDHIYKLLPVTVRDRAYSYLDIVFEYSSKFNIDPLWALSVLWTESHFKPSATSQVNAQGLMQIMPRTGVYLNKLLKRPEQKKLVLELLKDPESNIELGTFYLRRLHKRFKSYRYATVAYNMGPSFVVRGIRTGGEVGVNNKYYDKVKKRYRHLLKVFKNLKRESYEESYLSVITYKPITLHLSYFTGEDIQLINTSQFAKR